MKKFLSLILFSFFCFNSSYADQGYYGVQINCYEEAIHVVKKIDYYCFSFKDFEGENEFKHENIPNLCDKFNIKKNLINPI